MMLMIGSFSASARSRGARAPAPQAQRWRDRGGAPRNAVIPPSSEKGQTAETSSPGLQPAERQGASFIRSLNVSRGLRKAREREFYRSRPAAGQAVEEPWPWPASRPALSRAPPSGIGALTAGRPGFGNGQASCDPDGGIQRFRAASTTKGSMRVSRSLHGLWRKAVRTPVNSLRARICDAVAARKQGGLPVSVDAETALKRFRSRAGFRRRARNAPCRARQYRTRLHPLSVNSTTTEAMHYVPHTVDAPAMTLEHLVDQFWFPKLGLLISNRAWSGAIPFSGRSSRAF